jgi:hypothetical protein
MRRTRRLACWSLLGVAIGACGEGEPLGVTGFGTGGPAIPSDTLTDTDGESESQSQSQSQGSGEADGSTTETSESDTQTETGDDACMPGTSEACYTGDATTEDVGVCRPGTRECDDAGMWGWCEDEVTPNDESCDGLDNDCDGDIDETCDCTPSETQDCYGRDMSTLDVGECVGGTQTCAASGTWGECEGDVTPIDELCNGNDDDCDAENDEGNPEGGTSCVTGLLGVCATGVQTCVDTAITCVQVTQSSAETCDGADNDCDGASDEGNPGGGGACNTGLQGVCASGALLCNAGELECDQNVASSAETCDGQDNDCDGPSDEGNPGGGASCSTGLLGACSAGTMSCSAGGLSCQQNIASAAESCDEIDNDCDGSVDENFGVDASNGGVDYPNLWSVAIPQMAEYPGTGAGVLAGRLLPEGDNDWFTFYAVEDLSDIFGDTAVKGAMTLTSPGAGLWYEVCACWSSTTTYCGMDQASGATCVTSQGGSPVALQVNMDMSLGSTDSGYLDVVIRPDIPSIDFACAEWGLTWEIWE